MIFALLIYSVVLYSQNGTFYMQESTNYRVYSDLSNEHADEIAGEMEAYVKLYQEFFHFPAEELSGKMTIRMFTDKDAYTAYVSGFIEEVHDDFVFLQYKDATRSELVAFDSGDIQRALVHHGSIQFMKAFISEPPLWLQKGIAVYLEKSYIDPETGNAVFKVNYDWVPFLKELHAKDNPQRIPVTSLLSITIDDANAKIDSFYAQSWALLSFFVESNQKRYNRLLWETLRALKNESTRHENESQILTYGFTWVNKEEFDKDFNLYVQGLKSFAELVRLGVDEYSFEKNDTAEELFREALRIEPDNYIPYYYLGLIQYRKNDFPLSEYYYRESLDKGSEPALTYYALGINAYAGNNLSDAMEYLRLARENDPEKYGKKATELMTQIQEEMNSSGGA